jgi:hypothetical protein
MFVVVFVVELLKLPYRLPQEQNRGVLPATP